MKQRTQEWEGQIAVFAACTVGTLADADRPFHGIHEVNIKLNAHLLASRRLVGLTLPFLLLQHSTLRGHILHQGQQLNIIFPSMSPNNAAAAQRSVCATEATVNLRWTGCLGLLVLCSRFCCSQSLCLTIRLSFVPFLCRGSLAGHSGRDCCSAAVGGRVWSDRNPVDGCLLKPLIAAPRHDQRFEV